MLVYKTQNTRSNSWKRQNKKLNLQGILMGRVVIEIPETSGLLCLNLGLSWTLTRLQTHSRLGMVTKKKIKKCENKKTQAQQKT